MTAELHKLNAQKSSDAPWGVFDVILDELTTNMTNNDSPLVGIYVSFYPTIAWAYVRHT